MKKDFFWMDKTADGFTTIHFKDGTSISCETEQLAVKMAFEILANNGVVGY